MAFLLWTWACDQLKPTTGQRITLKNTSPQWVIHLSPRYSQVPLVSGYLFDSFQLTVTWMSTIKLNTDCIYLGHLASNARSLHENSQSERAYYWSHIINTDIELDSLSGQSSFKTPWVVFYRNQPFQPLEISTKCLFQSFLFTHRGYDEVKTQLCLGKRQLEFSNI